MHDVHESKYYFHIARIISQNMSSNYVDLRPDSLYHCDIISQTTCDFGPCCVSTLYL